MAKKRKGSPARKLSTHRPRAPELTWASSSASSDLASAMLGVDPAPTPNAPAHVEPTPAPDAPAIAAAPSASGASPESAADDAPITVDPRRPVVASLEVTPAETPAVAPPVVHSIGASRPNAPVSVQQISNRTVEPSTLAPVALDKTQPSGSVQLPPNPAPRGLVEDHDEQALSFFHAAEPMIAPEEPVEDDAPAAPSVSPEVLHRRLMFRKAVSALMGMAATLALSVGVKAVSARPTPAEAFTAVAAQKMSLVAEAQAAALPPPAVTAPARTATPAPAPSPEPAATPTPAALAAPVVAPAAQPSAPASAPQAAAAAAPAVDPAAARELTKQALSLLERGNYKASIEKAASSVEADPTDANAYLYWGTALMELGKHKEAKVVFARCVETATRGPKHECRTFR